MRPHLAGGGLVFGVLIGIPALMYKGVAIGLGPAAAC
jgi:hypothetical protein